eukprot:UN10326
MMKIVFYYAGCLCGGTVLHMHTTLPTSSKSSIKGIDCSKLCKLQQTITHDNVLTGSELLFPTSSTARHPTIRYGGEYITEQVYNPTSRKVVEVNNGLNLNNNNNNNNNNKTIITNNNNNIP